MGSRRASQPDVLLTGHGLCSTIPVTPLSPAGLDGAGARVGAVDGPVVAPLTMVPGPVEACPAVAAVVDEPPGSAVPELPVGSDRGELASTLVWSPLSQPDAPSTATTTARANI